MKNKHKEALSSDIFGYRKAAAAEAEVAKAHSNSNSIETTEEDATGDNKERKNEASSSTNTSIRLKASDYFRSDLTSKSASNHHFSFTASNDEDQDRGQEKSNDDVGKRHLMSFLATKFGGGDHKETDPFLNFFSATRHQFR